MYTPFKIWNFPTINFIFKVFFLPENESGIPPRDFDQKEKKNNIVERKL